MMESEKVWDVIIVGAGAAGMMCAIHAARAGFHVLLLEGQKRVGAKILMSGGTRCNVTNQEVTEKDFASENIRFVRHVLQGFSSNEVLEFFQGRGVDLVLEEGGKYFPQTGRAETVLEVLLKGLGDEKVTLREGMKVREIIKKDAYFRIQGDSFDELSQSLVLATGGLSYPTTGSDGTGYRLAESLGHYLVPTSAALTPFLTDDLLWKSLMGVSLPVRLSLWVQNRKIREFCGPFLFTHFGFSGPTALNMSRFWDREKGLGKELRVQFLWDQERDVFERVLIKNTDEKPLGFVKSFLSEMLPDRLAGVLLLKGQFDEHLRLHQLKKGDRRRLIEILFSCPLSAAGVFGFRKAEVTAGGVDLTKVDSASLQSKITPGLFFCGEILDADGRIGGFNFQWAWSSAVVASRGIRKYLED